jgi:hypothetical protein
MILFNFVVTQLITVSFIFNLVSGDCVVEVCFWRRAVLNSLKAIDKPWLNNRSVQAVSLLLNRSFLQQIIQAFYSGRHVIVSNPRVVLSANTKIPRVGL